MQNPFRRDGTGCGENLRPAWRQEWDAGISELKPRSSRHDGYVVGEPFPWPSRGSLVAYDFLSQPEPAQPSRRAQPDHIYRVEPSGAITLLYDPKRR